MKSLVKSGLLILLLASYYIAGNTTFFLPGPDAPSGDYQASAYSEKDTVASYQISHSSQLLNYSITAQKDCKKFGAVFFIVLPAPEALSQRESLRPDRSGKETLSEIHEEILFPFHTFW